MFGLFMAPLISLGLSYLIWLLMRDDNKQKNKPPSQDEFSVPRAEEGAVIGKGWGTFIVKSWLVLNWNKTKSKRVIIKVKEMFGTTKQETQNFKHYADVHGGICLADDGALVQLLEIRLDDKTLWTNPNPTAGDVSGSINLPDFFSEDNGLSGSFTFYSGRDGQVIDDYLNKASLYNGYASAWPKQAHIIFKDFWFATSSGPTNVPTLSFLCRHMPIPSWTNSSVASWDGKINPFMIVWYMLVDDYAGAGIDISLLDLNSFTVAAQRCRDDNLGVCHYSQQTGSAIAEITNILEAADATIYTDIETGKVKVEVFNRDYVFDDLVHVTQKDIIQYQYSRNSINQQVSEVRVTYTDMSENFKEVTTPYRNSATRIRRGSTAVKTLQYKMIVDIDTANRIAAREGYPLTTSMLQLNLDTTRILATHKLGDAVRVSIPKIGVEDMVFRIQKINYGKLKSTSVNVELIQDRFGEFRDVFSSDNGQIIPERNATALNASLQVITAPYYFNANKNVLIDNLILTMAQEPNNRNLYYELWTDSTTTTDYIKNGQANGFTPMGKLTSSIGVGNNSLTISSTDFISVDIQKDGLASGVNLCLLVEGSNYEFINFEKSVSSGSNYIITGINRGLLDTIPKAFTNSAKLYAFSYGFALNDTDFFMDGEAISIKALSVTSNETLKLPDASTINYTVTNRPKLPIVVSNLKINNTAFNNTQLITGDLKIDWSWRNKIGSIQYYNDQVVNNTELNNIVIQIYNGATLIKTVTFNDNTTSYTFTDEKTLNAGNYFSALKVKIKTTSGVLESVDKYDLMITRTV